jgi:HAD superfamily hydrolase (TIGR01549 family)
MKNYNLYFFDFDNTLTKDPLEINYAEIRNELCKIIGKYDKFVPIIDTIYEYDNKLLNFKRHAFDIIDKYEKLSINNAVCDENVVKLYVSLPKEKKVIISRNGEGCIKKFLEEHHLEYPSVICSRDNIKNLKPDPEAYLYIKSIYNNLNELNILMIGDSVHDELFARNCNIDYKNKINC